MTIYDYKFTGGVIPHMKLLIDAEALKIIERKQIKSDIVIMVQGDEMICWNDLNLQNHLLMIKKIIF